MERYLVIRTIDRAPADVVAGLAEQGVATIHEAIGQTGLMDPRIRPIQTEVRIAGSAVTVLSAPGDNIMVHAAVETVRPGDVVVIATTSPSTNGMVGELIATSLAARGCVGAVIDAGVRDVAELKTMGFPVWARAVHAQGTAKASPGSVNTSILCAGVEVNAGDVVVADDDGVVVVPRLGASAALEAARSRTAKEVETRALLERGELSVDVYDMRSKLAGLGVEYLDRTDDR